MADTPRNPVDEVLFAKASSWFARLHADDVTAEERHQFEVWRGLSPDHARAWDEVRALFEDLQAPAALVHESLQQRGDYPFAQAHGARSPTDSAPRRVRKRLIGRTIAAVLIACVAAAILWGPQTFQNLTSDYHTRRGEQRHITLTDGSQIFLNTDSAISIDLSDHRRRLTLRRGEAYFEIAPDPKRPAAVVSQQGEARVLGTAFNVAQRQGETTVTVAAGAVDIWHSTQPAQPTPVRTGQQVRYNAQGVSTVQAADLTDVLAWQHGQITFWQRPLADVIEEVNRYSSGRIIIVNPAIRSRPVTGAFDLQRLDHLLDALRLGLGIQAAALTPYLTLLY